MTKIPSLLALTLSGFAAIATAHGLYLILTAYLMRERFWLIGLIMYGLYFFAVIIMLFILGRIACRGLAKPSRLMRMGALTLIAILFFAYYAHHDQRLQLKRHCSQDYDWCLYGP